MRLPLATTGTGTATDSAQPAWHWAGQAATCPIPCQQKSAPMARSTRGHGRAEVWRGCSHSPGETALYFVEFGGQRIENLTRCTEGRPRGSTAAMGWWRRGALGAGSTLGLACVCTLSILGPGIRGGNQLSHSSACTPPRRYFSRHA